MNNYASAKILFLDRDSDSLEPAVLYPISKIELQEFHYHKIVNVREFIVYNQGHWTELQ